jgi:tetratricopeptide (TPR) repeat protein
MPRSPRFPLSRGGNLGLRLALPAVLLLLLTATACQYDRESRLAEIRALQSSGQFDESIAPLRVLLTAEADHPEANFRLGMALVQTGRPSLAIWPLQKASQSEELKLQAGLLLASTLLATESYEEAIRAADQVLTAKPDLIAALVTRAQADIGAGRPADALVDSDHILQLKPENFQGLTLRLAALIDLERFDDAEETHLDMIGRFEEKGDTETAGRACALLGTFYATRDDNEKATATMLDCFEKYPTHGYVQQSASDFFTATEAPEKAIAMWREAIEHTPEDIGLRTKLAELLYETGKTDEAEAAYKETVELFDSRQAWQMLSVFYRRTGRITEAREALEKALERSPQEPPALRFAMADILIAEGEFDRAEEIANSMQEPSYRTLLRGSIALAKGDPAAALKLLESGLRLWPNNAGARYIAGQAALQMGDLQRALAEYREATRIAEDATDAALAMGRIYYSLGKYPAAGQFAARHINSRPFTTPDAHIIAIRSESEQGNWERATGLLANLNSHDGMQTLAVVEHAGMMRKKEGPEAAVTAVTTSDLDLTDPENAMALTSVALDLLALERATEALAKVNRALAKHPENPPFLDIHARLLAQMGKTEEATKSVNKALEIDPDFAPALEVAGRFAQQQGRLEEALELFDRAAAADPENAEYQYSSSVVAMHLGRPDESIARLRKVVSLSPGHVGATNDLAWRLAESGQELDLALDLANRATQLDRGPETLDTLGWVQLKRGNAAGASDSFEASLERRPDSPSVRYRLALAQAKKGDDVGARESLTKALDSTSFPEVQAARAELARLQNN